MGMASVTDSDPEPECCTPGLECSLCAAEQRELGESGA